MKEREKQLHQQIEENQKRSQPTENRSSSSSTLNNYLGLNLDHINSVGGNIPGFQMFKDRVIKPLIVATEKVVEYYF